MKGSWVGASEILVWTFCVVGFFLQWCECKEISYLFLSLATMRGEETGLILGNLCCARSYQPAGLPCDTGSERNSVSQLLLRQSGADFSAVLFPDLLWELNIAAVSIRFLWNTKPFPCRPVTGACPVPGRHWCLQHPFLHLWLWAHPTRCLWMKKHSQIALTHYRKPQGFPAPCKLGYLLGHYFKTSITHSPVFMLWCEGSLFKESISLWIYLVLIDNFPSCCDLPGMGRAVLIYASWRCGWLYALGMCATKKNHCLWSWQNHACWKKETNQISV